MTIITFRSPYDQVKRPVYAVPLLLNDQQAATHGNLGRKKDMNISRQVIFQTCVIGTFDDKRTRYFDKMKKRVTNSRQ